MKLVMYMNVKEKAVIVTTKLSGDKRDPNERESELEKLVETAGGTVVAFVQQNLKEINSKTYIGMGKVGEIQQFVENNEADMVVFNNELSGSQIRNLEKLIDVKVIDRTALILDIFALRAQTKEAKLQVRLAQLEYDLPRLIGNRANLSRTGAGIGTRGLGEQKLELDRRTIKEEIVRTKDSLQKIEKTRSIKRKQRLKSSERIVSLVGYTNAGKSTIFNQISNRSERSYEDVYADDRLFATLDTHTRQCEFRNGTGFILNDTVGFVEDIPTSLVESFKSTLEEISYSDLIVQIVDASNTNHEKHIDTTLKIIRDLDGASSIPSLLIFNKQDRLEGTEFISKYSPDLFINAFNESDIDALVEVIQQKLSEENIYCILAIPFSEYNKAQYLFDRYEIKNLIHTDEGMRFEVLLSKSDYERYRVYERE